MRRRSSFRRGRRSFGRRAVRRVFSRGRRSRLRGQRIGFRM